MAAELTRLTAELKQTAENSTQNQKLDYKPRKGLFEHLKFHLGYQFQFLETESMRGDFIDCGFKTNHNIVVKKVVGRHVREQDVDALTILIIESCFNQIKQVFGNPQNKLVFLKELQSDWTQFRQKFDFEIIKAVSTALSRYDNWTFRKDASLPEECRKFQLWYIAELKRNYGAEYRNQNLRSTVCDQVQIIDLISAKVQLSIFENLCHWLNGSPEKDADLKASKESIKEGSKESANEGVSEEIIQSCKDVLQLGHFLSSMEKDKENREKGSRMLLLEAYEQYKLINKFILDALEVENYKEGSNKEKTKYSV